MTMFETSSKNLKIHAALLWKSLIHKHLINPANPKGRPKKRPFLLLHNMDFPPPEGDTLFGDELIFL